MQYTRRVLSFSVFFFLAQSHLNGHEVENPSTLLAQKHRRREASPLSRLRGLAHGDPRHGRKPCCSTFSLAGDQGRRYIFHETRFPRVQRGLTVCAVSAERDGRMASRWSLEQRENSTNALRPVTDNVMGRYRNDGMLHNGSRKKYISILIFFCKYILIVCSSNERFMLTKVSVRCDFAFVYLIILPRTLIGAWSGDNLTFNKFYRKSVHDNDAC